MVVRGIFLDGRVLIPQDCQVLTEGNAIAGSGPSGSATRVQASYARYPSGEAAHITYPNGSFRIRRDYTARGQLQNVGWDDAGGNWATVLASYTYNAAGDPWVILYNNGVRSDFLVDERHRVYALQHYRASPFQGYCYRYYWRDARDRITFFIKGNQTSANPMENGRGANYTYDAEGQLTDVSSEGNDASGVARQEHFSYDALGNRQGVNQHEATIAEGMPVMPTASRY